MVTIFDMVTGELIADEGPANAASAHAATFDQEPIRHLVAPRLQTVEESRASEARKILPADLALTCAASFVTQQSR